MDPIALLAVPESPFNLPDSHFLGLKLSLTNFPFSRGCNLAPHDFPIFFPCFIIVSSVDSKN